MLEKNTTKRIFKAVRDFEKKARKQGNHDLVGAGGSAGYYGKLTQDLERGTLASPKTSYLAPFVPGETWRDSETSYPVIDVGLIPRKLPQYTKCVITKLNGHWQVTSEHNFASISISEELTGDFGQSFSGRFTDTNEEVTAYLAEAATGILSGSILWATWDSVREKWYAHVAPCSGGIDT